MPHAMSIVASVNIILMKGTDNRMSTLKLADWKTWLVHAAFAALVTWAFSFVLAPWTAGLLAFWGYMWRELDQMARKLIQGKPVPWLDAALDVAFPAVAAFLVAWWLT